MFNRILFDLDGTLTNPFEGMTNSIIYALKEFGIIVKDKKVLTPFIGPTLIESFKKYYNMTDEQAFRGQALYREYFGKIGLYENKSIYGIHKVLEALHLAGKSLVVATGKPQVFAERILKKFRLSKYFDFIAGATFDSSRVTKQEVISYALENTCGSKSHTIMIGDREHDVIGAKLNGIKSIGVLYGFGDEIELKNAGADFIVKKPKDLLNILL